MIQIMTALLLRILSNPLGNVFQKQLCFRGQHPFEINFATYFLLSICCIPFVLNVEWLHLSSHFWIFALLGGLAGAFGNSFLIKALQCGDLSILGPINSYKSVVAMFIGVLFLGEVPSLFGVVGIVLIIWGSYFIFDTLDEGFSWKLILRKDIQYRVYALVFTAIEAVLIKKIILLSSVNICFYVWCFFGMAFALLLLTTVKVTAPRSCDIPKYISLAACMGVMQLSTNYVFKHMNVSYALALFQLSVIVSVLFGYRFFREKDILKKLIGSVIMIAGAVAIILL